MKIITPGHLPPPPVYTGTCKTCGCVVEEIQPLLEHVRRPVYNTPYQWWNPFQTRTPASFVSWYFMPCPTEFCGRKIPMNPTNQTQQP